MGESASFLFWVISTVRVLVVGGLKSRFLAEYQLGTILFIDHLFASAVAPSSSLKISSSR